MKENKLFVYGSLMGEIQSPIANYLKSNSAFLGEGTVQGTLLDLGHYPGLIYDKLATSRVVGHIFQLNQVEEMLIHLDHYECVGEAFESPNQYRREIVQVQKEGKIINCWAYVYNLPFEGLKIIDSGNYLTYFQENAVYQQFVNSLNNFNRPI